MSAHLSEAETLMDISGFCMDDMEHIRHLGGHLLPRIPALTDSFYERLLANESTRPYLEGRTELLKKTHIAWLADVIAGDYGKTFRDRQRHIGKVHVAAGIPPLFVAASMSFLRGAFSEEIEIAAKSAGEPSGRCTAAVLRLLDLCQYLIDSAYEAERMRRLTNATGMSTPLLNNLIGLKPKAA